MSSLSPRSWFSQVMGRAFALSLAAMSGASCVTPATEILVTIDTDAPASLPLRVRVRVARQQDPSSATPIVWTFRTGDADPRLPATFAVVPEAGQREGAAWIYLDATFGDSAPPGFTLHRVVSTRFVAGATVPVSIFLNAACGAAASGCASTSGAPCTVAIRCEEQGLTCGDDGRCAGAMGLDSSVTSDATADVARDTSVDTSGDRTSPDAPSDHPVVDVGVDVPVDARADVTVDAVIDTPSIDARADAPVTDAPLDVASDRVTVDVPAMDVLVCSGALTRCGAACVDTATDERNCGLCGRVCATSQACAAGVCRCVPSCAGRVCGDDGCGGSCGACVSPHVCTEAGACVCPAGSSACGAACCNASQACVAGACRCVPSCAGRVCGDDGCGGRCGACASPLVCDITSGTCRCATGTTACGAACCASGESCIAGRCCPSAWRREFSGVIVQGTARGADGSYLLAGREGVPDTWVDGNRAFVATLDACGATIAQNTFMPSGVSRANPVAVVTQTAARVPSTPPVVLGFAANGTGDIDGFYTSLTSLSLTPTVTTTIRSTTGDDLFWQGVQSPDGNVWAVGSAGATGCSVVALGSPTATTFCTWNVFADCAGAGGGFGAAIGHDGNVWVVGARGANAYWVRYPSSRCAASPGCSCASVAGPSEFAYSGAMTTAVRGVAAGPTTTFLAGYAFTAGIDALAFVASVSTDGRMVFSAGYSPTSRGDGYLAAAYSATPTPTLYASGLRNWDGVGNTAHATGIVAAYDPTTLAQRWVSVVPGAGSCWNVQADSAGGVVVTCTGLTSSTIRRCSSSGVCP